MAAVPDQNIPPSEDADEGKPELPPNPGIGGAQCRSFGAKEDAHSEKGEEMEELKARLNDLEDTCNKKERELTSLKQTLQLSEESLKQRDKEIDVLRIQFINKIAQVKDLERVRENLEDQLKEKMNELSMCQERENQMSEKQKEKEKELKEREKRVFSLEADDRLDSIRTELQGLRESTKQELFAKDNEFKMLLRNQQEKENIISMQDAELKKLKDLLKSIEEKLKRKTKELEECRESREPREDYSGSGIEMLRLQLVSKIRESKDQRKSLENFEEKLRQKGEELENNKRSFEALDKMLKDKDAKILLFQRNATMAELQLNGKEAELESLRRFQRAVSTGVKRQDLGNEAVGLRIELVDRLKEIRDLKRIISMLENQLYKKGGADKDAENTFLRIQLVKKLKEIQELKKEKDCPENPPAVDCGQKLKDVETELATLKENLKASADGTLQAKFMETLMQMKELQRISHRFEENVESKLREIESLNLALESVENNLRQKEAELDAKCKTPDERTNNLRKELDQLRQSNKEIMEKKDQELETLRSSLQDAEIQLGKKNEDQHKQCSINAQALKAGNETLQIKLELKSKLNPVHENSAKSMDFSLFHLFPSLCVLGLKSLSFKCCRSNFRNMQKGRGRCGSPNREVSPGLKVSTSRPSSFGLRKGVAS
ncbi:putative leucine-rich repeat-containing protein DDB_G0290503 isoform X17 [Narcine bancroftii]|uniref:putative leucine-rich repeat-containing protein DDB_G0290503 isoform X17 n=1 Tax=Narcine bancroftii TaxID=1343680 RepID=UPI00383179BC